MSNYKIIVDEQALDEFIDFLPKLEEGEAYYISLMGRSKYLKGTEHENVIKGDRSKLKRSVATQKSRIKQKIRQMETALGTYDDDKGTAIPQEALALYISVNPRDLRTASAVLSKNITDGLLNNKYINPFTESLKAIQTSTKKRRFLEYDFDVDKSVLSVESLLEEILANTALTKDKITIVETRGGFHVLINTLLLKGMKVNWAPAFQEIWGKYSTDTKNSGEQLIPVPGTYQGSFIPKLYKW